MIFWSVLPTEIVLSNTQTPPIYEEVECSGLKLLVEKNGPKQCKIIRLLTTNPSDYLRPELQPGNVLTYEPTLKDSQNIID